MREHRLAIWAVLEVLYPCGGVDQVVIRSKVQIECLIEGGKCEAEGVCVAKDGGVYGEGTLAVAICCCSSS